MDAFATDLQPLPGSYSGETFATEVAGEPVVVRIYGPRSAWRGPRAPEVDAAVLRLVGDLLPVPAVLEARAGDPSRDLPGLLVLTRLPGERLDLLLPGLAEAQQVVVGRQLGTLVGRLGHMVQPRPGMFTDPDLTIGALPAGAGDAGAWVEAHADRLRGAGLGGEVLERLRVAADRAQAVLDEDPRVVLVHSDLNAKNVLVDPRSLEVTGLVDWEYAHAGSPYADLGNLLRDDVPAAYAEAVLDAYRAFVPGVPADVLDRARAADLVALVDLAARTQSTPVVTAARERLLALARAVSTPARTGWTPPGGRR